jgi:hypothetical protein
LKHLRDFAPPHEDAFFSLLESLHTISLLASLPAIPSFSSRLANAYEAEHRVHTLAAHVSMRLGSSSSSFYLMLFIIACQLHILAVTSSLAPLTIKLREFLLGRARSTLDSIGTNEDAHQVFNAPLLWALFTFAARSVGQSGKLPFFIDKITAAGQEKKFQTKASLVQVLRAWPWVERWHMPRMHAIWSELLIIRGSHGRTSRHKGTAILCWRFDIFCALMSERRPEHSLWKVRENE